MEGRHESIWIASSKAEGAPPLREELECDVAVVGGGMVGLVTAHMLQEAGKDVVVVEADRILHGVTGHTTAKVTAQHGDLYHRLQARHGKDAARTHAEANLAGMAWIAKTAQRLDVDLVRAPAHVYATTPQDAARLKKEADAATEAGLATQFVTDTELPFAVSGAIRLPDQIHFNPMRFLEALAGSFTEQGGRIFEKTRVLKVRDGARREVRTPDGRVQADHVVVATNAPINDKTFFVGRMKPVREYGIAVRGGVPLEGMYINNTTPRRSVRPYGSEEGPMLIVVGEEHPVGHGTATDRHHEALIAFAEEHLDAGEVAYRWSTQDLYPVDDLPFIGPTSPTSRHVWTATGFQGWGMSQSPAAAMILADAVQGRKNDWARLYDPFSPDRLTKEIKGATKLGAHVAKRFIADRLGHEAAADLSPGEAKVVDIKGKKIAMHRDQEGRLHKRSATCTHMGCIIGWNAAESSWDCPCHGSRFAADGEVLHGPATRPLADEADR